MQLLLNAGGNAVVADFILNKKVSFVGVRIMYDALYSALPSQYFPLSNLAYRHTSSTRFEHRGPNRTIQTDGTHPEERCRNSCGEKGAAQGSAGPRDWQEKRELKARES